MFPMPAAKECDFYTICWRSAVSAGRTTGFLFTAMIRSPIRRPEPRKLLSHAIQLTRKGRGSSSMTGVVVMPDKSSGEGAVAKSDMKVPYQFMQVALCKPQTIGNGDIARMGRPTVHLTPIAILQPWKRPPHGRSPGDFLFLNRFVTLLLHTATTMASK